MQIGIYLQGFIVLDPRCFRATMKIHLLKGASAYMCDHLLAHWVQHKDPP